jgi:hypothetical protein
MATANYIKDPGSDGNYVLEWATYLAPGGTIATSTWEVPTDLNKLGDSHDDSNTAILVSGGVSGSFYVLYNTITSDAGFVMRRAIGLQVLDAALISEPSALEDQLSALRVALGQKAAKDVAEYQIANRMKRSYSFEDLLAWEKRLTELVNQERQRVGGSGFFKNHFVRRTEPYG